MKLFFTLVAFLFVCISSFAQKKMRFYDDTAQMRKEILAHIPVGTDIETAKKIMKKNRFKIQVMKVGEEHYRSEFIKVPLDYIFCKRTKSGLSWISKAWAVAIIYKDEKVVDVKNELWLTGP